MATTLPCLRVAYVLSLLELLERQGLDRTATLRSAGIDPARLTSPEEILTLAEFGSLVATLTRRTRRGDLAFEMAWQLPLSAHGVLGYGFLRCRSLDECLRLISRYGSASYGLSKSIYERGAEANAPGVFTVLPVAGSVPPSLQRFCDELAAVSTVLHCRKLVGIQSLDLQVWLGCDVPVHLERYAALAPARFNFDRRRGAGFSVEIPAGLLDQPVRVPASLVLAPPGIVEPRRLPRPVPGESWSACVLRLLRENTGTAMGIETVALRLGLSTRTLDRYLAKEGQTFRALSRELLVARACQLLRDPGTSVAAVAGQLGFSNAANFTRAFRHATGMAPSEYQQQHLP